MQETKKKTKKRPDPFKKLKYIAYSRAFTPPEEGMTYEQFIDFIKTYLCFETKTLFKDPLWDTYSDEELVIEYYARLFRTNPDRKAEFERELGGSGDSQYDEFLKFADKAIEKNQEELSEKDDEYEDSLSFSPDTIGD